MAVDYITSQATPVKRTGHARFRRAPSDSNGPSTSTQSAPVKLQSTDQSTSYTTSSSTSSRSTNSSSFLLSPGEEESVSNGKRFSFLGVVSPVPTFSARKPPLPSSHRKRCAVDRPTRSENNSGCHCRKRRKTSKREIRRVPITGSNTIPADDYTWKKYGEKRREGSPYPSVYYKCNTGKGCPARKRVEITLDDPKMLLVTYAGEHVHGHAPVLSVQL
uniref:WRKY21 n=1 Tax=Chrysanthemum morifolium TaxID=41568 RepID=A0A0F6P9Y5_CHRMO|nr:WRKY21 [Chrysanthemum x morifolium]